MRRAYIGVGLLLVAALGVGLFTTRTHGQPGAGGAGGNAAADHKKITVTGVGVMPVKPDTARVSFAVKGSGTDFKAAVADCDKKAAAVKKAVADLKLNGLDVKFGPVNLLTAAGLGNPPPFGPGGPPPMPGGPPPGGPGPGPGGPPPGMMGGIGGPIPGGPPFPGGPGVATVEVSRTFTVVATFGGKNSAGEPGDIVAVSDKTLAAAIAAGATEPPVFVGGNGNGNFGIGGGLGGGQFGGIGGNSRIEFSRSNYAQLRQDALKLAVADAVANAKAAAGVANLTAKDIVSLSDQVPNAFGLGAPANTGRGEVMGETELTVQVIVTFNY